MEASEAIKVTDEDRKAAAAITVLPEMRELILAGRADHHAEPFAAHRIAALEEAAVYLEAVADRNTEASTYCRSGNAGRNLRAHAQRRRDDATAIRALKEKNDG